MGRKSLEPWLLDFLWGEIEAVISWRRQSTHHGIKADPDSRFSDDGSNLRNHIASPPPGPSLLLQLRKVLSIKDPATVILSDGATQVKARLSEAAVAMLAAETEDNVFGFDVTGDIIDLQNFTIVTTPVGPSDSFIQLFIDDIQWDSLSRKVLGDPKPVEDADEIRTLLNDIVRLRCSSDDSSNVSDDGEAGRGSLNADDFTVSSQLNAGHGPSIVAQPVKCSRGSASTSQPLLTQMSLEKRALGPTLAHDGFQIENGVNLHRPLQPGSPSALRQNNVSDPVHTHKDSNRKLLELLNRKRHREEEPEPAFLVQEEEIIASDTPQKAMDDVDFHQSPPVRLTKNTAHSAGATNVVATATSSKSPPSAQPPPARLASSLPSSGKSIESHGRIKIPGSQKKLLETPESWLPSLPGKRFPAPNVPIELLDKWRHTTMQTHQQPRSDAFGAAQLPGSDVAVSSDEELSWSESEVEEAGSLPSPGGHPKPFSTSQWPPTQSPQRPDLPPDSSAASVVQGTSPDDLEINIPRTLAIRKTPTKAGYSGPLSSPRPKKSSAAVAPPRFDGLESLSSTTPNGSSQSRVLGASSSAMDILPPAEVPHKDSVARTSKSAAGFSKTHGLITQSNIDNIPSGNGVSGPTDVRAKASTPTAPRAMRPAEQLRDGENFRTELHSSPINSSGSMWSIRREHRSSNRSPYLSRPPNAKIDHSSSPFRNPPMVGRRPLTSPQLRDAAKQSNAELLPDRHLVGTYIPSSIVQNLDANSNANGHSDTPRQAPAQGRMSSSNANQSSPLSARPNAINTNPSSHPDETFRRRRKEYLNKTKSRRNWLQNTYSIHPNGTLRFQDVLRSYRHAQRDDEVVEAEEFGEAVMQAFPDANGNPLQMSFELRQQRERQHRPHAANHTPSMDAAANDQLDNEAQTVQVAATPATNATSGDVLREFCDNWLRVKPGGHFKVSTQNKKPPRRSVDVLEWGK